MHITTTNMDEGTIGVVNNTPETALVNNEQFSLIFCGSLVNLKTASTPPTVLETGQALATLYRQGGVHELTGLNGLFIIAVWDKIERQLQIINNQLGIQKCYYAQQNDCFYFSSEYKTIINNPLFNKKINNRSIAEWFMLGYQLEEKTFFEDVFALPSGTILEYKNRQVNLIPYWQPKYHEPGDPVLSERDYIDGFADHFQRSVSRRISTDTQLLLSGGLDSRTILGFAKRINPDIRFFSNTIGSPNCQDVQIAKKLSNHFNIQHTHIPVGLDYFEKYTINGVTRGEGYLRAFESWILAENEYLSTNQPAKVILGLLGNVMNGRFWPEGDINDDTVIINHLLRKKKLVPLMTNLLKPEIGGLLTDVFDHLLQLYQQSPYQTPARKFDYVSLKQGNHRHAATPDTLGDHAFYYEPFMDHDLVIFCNSIPVNILHNGQIVKKAIQKYIPEVTQVGYYSPHFPLKTALSLDQYKLWKPLLNNYRRIIRRLKFPDQDNPFGYVFPNQALRSASRNFVLRTIREKDIYADFLNPDIVFQIVDDHYNKKTNDYFTISSILTFIHWLKFFMFPQEEL